MFYWLISGYAARALLAIAVLALAGFAWFAWREFKLAKDSRGRLGAGIATLGFAAAAILVAYGGAELTGGPPSSIKPLA